MYFTKHILAQIRSLAHISMGSWDELCLLCGVYGGPAELLSKYGLDEVAKTIAAEIRPNDNALVGIVQEALLASFSEKEHLLSYVPPWLPQGMGNEGYSTHTWVAVGCFNEDGEAPLRDGKIPDGRQAEVRRVRHGDGGEFETLLVDRDGEEVEEASYTVCSTRREEGLPNVFLCERCYSYLEKWLDQESLPPRSCAFPSETQPLSISGELYEIVNSRKARRDEYTTLLPDVDYDGIQASLIQWQTHFMPCRRDSKHLSHAIDAGLRGAQLIPALLRDCRAWMFMRPDIWPVAPRIVAPPMFTAFPTRHRDSPMPAVGNLPNELLLPILHDLPLASLLALSATCRALRTLITEPSFMDRVLEEAIMRGSLRWILPAQGLLDEEQRAYDAIRLWLPEEHRPEPYTPPSVAADDADADIAVPVSAAIAAIVAADGEREEKKTQKRASQNAPGPNVLPLLMSPHLDRLAFVRACWESDSMINRKRLWRQVKRFETLWEDYRLHGWQVNRFYAPDEPMADSHMQ